ncbi:MAG: MBL fold metallo-hydrolase [Acidobacteria bacterium]|nr:MBL fold metallo-hydrolase [Acidobacteriota bacterium]
MSLFAMLAVVLFALPRTGQAADDSYYHVQEIKPNVFVWVAGDILYQEGDPAFNRAGNAGFIITPDGVVVIDTTNSPFNARALLFEIRKRTDQPVRYVINTGGSPDLMLGNEAFADFRPVILSTPAAAQAMRNYKNDFPTRAGEDWKFAVSMRGIHPLPPTETFEKEDTIRLGGVDIRLINLGNNASPGDAAVYLPGSKVLFLGDVFENEYIPHIGSANLERWISTLGKFESWDADVIVPGHGSPAGKAQVKQFRGFLQWLYGRVRSEMQSGKSLAQIEGETVPFPDLHWHAPELESEAVAAIYRLLEENNSKDRSASSAKTPGP